MAAEVMRFFCLVWVGGLGLLFETKSFCDLLGALEVIDGLLSEGGVGWKHAVLLASSLEGRCA